MSELHAALVAALAEMPDITKDRKAKVEMKGGGSYSYSYADLGSVIDAVRPILARNGLGVVQDVSGLPDNRIGVTTIIVHKSGETLATGPLPMPGSPEAQKVGSAITYARRYALLATLGLATDDDDGRAASQPPAPEQTYSAAAVQLFTACRNLPDDRKAALKEFAAENGRKVSTAAFDTDTAWADQVRAFIQLGATKESK